MDRGREEDAWGAPPGARTLWVPHADVMNDDLTLIASLDRGFGRCMVLKKFTASLKKYSNGTTERALPRFHPEASA